MARNRTQLESHRPLLAWATDYAGDIRMPEHEDGRSHLSLVLAGRVRESFGGREVSQETLGVALKSADARHVTRFGPEGARIASIDLQALSRQERGGFGLSSLPAWRWLPGRQILPEVRATIAALVDYRHCPDCPQALDVLREAALLLTDAFRDGASTERAKIDGWLRTVREHIDDEPSQTVPVARLAEQADVSATHLSRRFRAAFGVSVTTYRNLRRVQMALVRLTRSESRLADVAADCGFHDQSHFTRHFRRLVGVTPGAWRDHVRER